MKEDWTGYPRSTHGKQEMQLTQLSIQWLPEAPTLGVKRPGRETNHPLPSGAEVKIAWSYTSTHPLCLHGMVLSQAQGQVYLTFTSETDE